MTVRGARALAWTMWAVACCSVVAAGVLETLYPTATTTTSDPVSNFVWASSWFGFGFVGALIVSNRPGNRIGWVLCGITFSLGVALVAPTYGDRAYANGLPLAGAATWVSTWGYFVTIGLVGALLLLFPDGRLASRRRRWTARALATVMGVNAVAYALLPGPVMGDARPVNPLGIEALASQLHTATEIAGHALAIVMVTVLVDLLARFWRSRGVERQQFRWFAFAALAFPVLATVVNALGEQQSGFDPITAVFFVCGNALAAAIGVAITRHGLYEINRVISRTITYGVLTLLLVALYLAAVTVLTALTAPVTGKSPIAVAAATLLAAAVFGPARRRIQGAVDRRFNRARYDATVTVDAYRGRLRDEVDLETVSSDLVETVSAAMQPATTHLWLAGADSPAEKFSGQTTAVTVSERHREKKGT